MAGFLVNCSFTKGDIYVPGTHTKIFFFIFRLMTYTDVCFFFTLGRSVSGEETIPQLNEK